MGILYAVDYYYFFLSLSSFLCSFWSGFGQLVTGVVELTKLLCRIQTLGLGLYNYVFNLMFFRLVVTLPGSPALTYLLY